MDIGLLGLEWRDLIIISSLPTKYSCAQTLHLSTVFVHNSHNFFSWQRAMKVVSDSPGLVDFAFGLVNSVLNLSDGQVNFLGKFKLQKDGNQSCYSKRVLGLVEMTCGLVLASYSLPEKTDFLCTLLDYLINYCYEKIDVCLFWVFKC